MREELGWPSARQLYQLHSLTFFHKMLNTGEPQALASHLQLNSSLRSRSTRQDTALALPRVRTEAGRRRHMYSVAQLYNTLPLVFRDLTPSAFRRQLTNHLLGSG